ncbi:Cytosine/adenosine deaminase [Rhizobiales bacterium GAS191]|nr:Cytosine/adenosine deaminase [Rhizobiales bacterium GAS113]SEE83733.1 Cytosine/adenosine deaminase [Rhizobiales bacterium GAS191]
MTTDLIIKNCRPMGGAATDLLVREGRIAELGTAIAVPGATVENAAGALLLPGLVEAHTHLDKTLWGMGWHKHAAGPRLIDKIDNERASKKRLDIDPARQSARQVVLSLAQGTTHIRSHVDVDTDHGLWGIEGVMAMRERYRDAMDIEIVAFPQSGMLRRPGTVELMEQAMRLGSEVVGGLDPCAIDRDPKGHLDVVFGLAQRHGRPIDIHLHEPGEMGAFSMDLIFERTRALGMQGKVTVSHAFCLGTPDRDLVDPLIAELAALDIAIMTTAPASRPAPPVRRLREAGIRICSGSDGIRDTWGPYGSADMLERAMFVGLRNNFRRDDELELAFDVCSFGGAAVMELKGYGLSPGCAADFLLVDAETIAEAVAAHPPRRLVVKRGAIVARDGQPLVQAP